MCDVKLSAAEWCFFRDGCNPADVYSRLRLAGYTALEMVNESRWALVRTAGLQILNLAAPGMRDGLNQAANHVTLVPAIRDMIQKARCNQIAQIIVFSGSRRGQSDADGIRSCTTALEQLAGTAEAAGVTLLLEVLNTHDHADYQCCSGVFAFEVARAVRSSHVKALYDVYHGHRMGEDVINTVVRNLEFIGHLHVAGSPKRDFPGDQQAIDYRHLVREAMAAGYGGYWGQEFCCGDDSVEQYCRAAALFESYAL